MEPTRDPDPVAPEPVAPDPIAPAPPAASTHTPAPAAPPAGARAAAGKPDLGKRFIAALIDGLIAFVLSWVVGLISGLLGGLVSAAYWVIRDGLDVDFMKQRSLGKQIMKLDVVRLDGRPMDLETSVKRNWMFGIGALSSILLYIPILGWALIPVVGLVALGIVLFEAYKVYSDPEGRRWGDSLAATKVIESAT